jgi:hypothetical protein
LEIKMGGFANVTDDYATSGHATNSYHYRGEAIDFVPTAKIWNVLYANRNMFAELFGPTRFRNGGLYHTGSEFSDASLQEEHQNHIHVAYTGGILAIDMAF